MSSFVCFIGKFSNESIYILSMNARKHAKTPKKKVSPFAPLELTETSSTPHGSISPPVFPGSKNLTAIDSHILKAEL